MDIHSLLNELGSIMGLGSVSLGDSGTCRLVFDKTLEVDLELSRDQQTLHLVATVGAMPADDSPLLRSLLSANFMGQETGNACLALDELNNEVVLYQRLSLDTLQVSRFVSELEAFVNRLEDWKQRLAGGSLRSSPAASDLQSPHDAPSFPRFA